MINAYNFMEEKYKSSSIIPVLDWIAVQEEPSTKQYLTSKYLTSKYLIFVILATPDLDIPVQDIKFEEFVLLSSSELIFMDVWSTFIYHIMQL